MIISINFCWWYPPLENADRGEILSFTSNSKHLPLNLLSFAMSFKRHLIKFHSPPLGATQRPHRRALPGNLGAFRLVQQWSARWKCYEIRCHTKILTSGAQMATRLANIFNHCTLVKHNLFWSPNFLQVLQSGCGPSGTCYDHIQYIYNTYTIWIIWFLCKHSKNL